MESRLFGKLRPLPSGSALPLLRQTGLVHWLCLPINLLLRFPLTWEQDLQPGVGNPPFPCLEPQLQVIVKFMVLNEKKCLET